MDKYEFNLRIDQIKKKIASEDFETAMKIADTIDWRRVRNINILSMVSGVYEKNGEYQEAKDILLLAFERAPMGKRLLYKLAELAIKEGSPDEAEDYYREFCELAPEDPRQYVLRYLILGAKGAPVEQLIHTLEQYCNVELDEKWLYELAELYNEAHMEQLCVMTCDKIMLMFGTGKYVDKAIDLKVQYAPLTDYQMDLVENKDKYEARLKAVETEYNKKKPMVLPIDEEDAQEEQEAEDAYVYQQEAAYTKEPEPEEKVLEEQPETVFDDEETGEEEAFSNAVQEPEEEQELSCEEEESEADSEPEVSSEPEVVSGSSKEDETLRAQLHEAEAQEDLAKEMSQLAEEHGYSEETQAAQTQVLADIRHLKKGPMYSGSNHLMIEADEPEKGFELAVKTLKRIHQETGAKNQAAKITGARLNNRGIFTLSDKLTGKDLIIEQAGDMNEPILQELNQLMARDETGMSVVLIDTAERLEELHKTYPGLAKRFECIGTKIKSSEERARLRQLIQSIKPKNFSVIVRTSSEGKRVAELDHELKTLVKRWEDNIVKVPKLKAPAIVYEETARTVALLRDIFNPSFQNIYVNDKEVYNNVRDYVSLIAPGREEIVQLYTGELPIFDNFAVTKQIKSLFGRTVTYKSGAYLIIDRTEAMHVIDVNSGNRSKGSDAQEIGRAHV